MGQPHRSLFQRSALLSGLVTEEDFERALAVAGEQQDGSGAAAALSDEQLAAALVEQDVLTAYQAEQLQAGRTKLSLGPYLITDWIGQGGMGQVFKAVHKVMGRESAIKVLPLSKSTPAAVASFEREIRTQAKLDHPNLVRAYDAGHDGNVHYLVTEYVSGADLRRLVRKQGPLPVQQAASVGLQAARALDYAHRRGLIHRDVKPGNVLVTPEGMAKVSDLGLAGFIDEAEADPRAGKIVGTADYLAPERIRSPAEVLPVSDIYALGCTLYYAVCGKVPFPSGTTADKCRRHLYETPWHPRKFNPDINEEFVEIIADMMEKSPEARIQTAAEAAARLEPWASEAGPIPTQHLIKSPWTPAPPPVEPDAEPSEETNSDLAVLSSQDISQTSVSQASQSTEGTSSAAQDTRRVPPPLPSRRKQTVGAPSHAPPGRGPAESVALALAIAVPISLAAGATLCYFAMTAL